MFFNAVKVSALEGEQEVKSFGFCGQVDKFFLREILARLQFQGGQAVIAKAVLEEIVKLGRRHVL